jgi:hypothetical protein
MKKERIIEIVLIFLSLIALSIVIILKRNTENALFKAFLYSVIVINILIPLIHLFTTMIIERKKDTKEELTIALYIEILVAGFVEVFTNQVLKAEKFYNLKYMFFAIIVLLYVLAFLVYIILYKYNKKHIKVNK